LSRGWGKEELTIFIPEGQRKRGKEGRIGGFSGFLARKTQGGVEARPAVGLV
jgi:hypothetical protein